MSITKESTKCSFEESFNEYKFTGTCEYIEGVGDPKSFNARINKVEHVVPEEGEPYDNEILLGNCNFRGVVNSANSRYSYSLNVTSEYDSTILALLPQLRQRLVAVTKN